MPSIQASLPGIEYRPDWIIAVANLVGASMRPRAGLPGELLDHRRLISEFELDREATILSPGSAEADPGLLSKSLLTSALSQGAKLFDAEASVYDQSSHAVFRRVG
jgi:hypothetical protein